MAAVTVLIFHRPASAADPPLVRTLAEVRLRLIDHHRRKFVAGGADTVRVVDEWRPGETFGRVLAAEAPAEGGVIVLGSGGVPLLTLSDARRLVSTAGRQGRHATTNNRYSSDVCAVSEARALRDLPALPSDNALPRWLEERAGYAVAELPGRDRLALDLDTPLDVALAPLAPGCPAWLRRASRDADLVVPRVDQLRQLAIDPHSELLVFGRAGSRTLRWLETHVRCRVRFLAEERGLRASSPLAIREPRAAAPPRRGPRATLGLLLDQRGPGALPEIVAELADGAIIDSRVLLAHRLGADEASWPSPHDRYASDLLRTGEIADPWLRELTAAAAASRLPILLGGHSLVGPGIRLLLTPRVT